MTIWVLILLLSTVAGLADLIGGFLMIISGRVAERHMGTIIALGAGFLLGATILDRLPDSMTELPNSAPLLIVIGYLAIFVSEQLFPTEAVHHHPHPNNHKQHVSLQSGLIAWIGLLIHTFFDGVVIAGAFELNKAAGVLMFLAITMHKLPEGFSMASVFLASGRDRRKALLSSASLGLSTMIGAVATLVAGQVNPLVVKVVMALATGTFIYITTSELFPALGGYKNRGVIVAAVAGVFLFYASLLFVKHVGLS